MPHLLINCSNNVLSHKSADVINQAINDAALRTNLFQPETIKVRIIPFEHFLNGGTKNDFIHIFANIMEGRTSEQKTLLTDNIISSLKELFPDIQHISVNVIDMDKTSYRKKSIN